MGDFNLALIIVAAIVCVLVFIFNVYLLVNYQHPDDVSQAYFPKFVVVLGLSVSIISILMLPADVANRQACSHAIYNGACNLTLPMKDLWMVVYIVDAALVLFVIPFAMFYYEGDQDKYVMAGLGFGVLICLPCGCWAWKRVKSRVQVLFSSIIVEPAAESSFTASFQRRSFPEAKLSRGGAYRGGAFIGEAYRGGAYIVGAYRGGERSCFSASRAEVSGFQFSVFPVKKQVSAFKLKIPETPLALVEKTVTKRIRGALCWVVVTAIVCALALGILYGVAGKVDFTVMHLSSSTTSFPSTWDFSSGQQCIGGAKQCSAFLANASSQTTWSMRATFPEYVVALATILGSVLFTIFGGVGIACLPLGLIFSFIRSPKAVITRSQKQLSLEKKARELKKAANELRQEEKAGNRGRKWRKNVKAVEKELLLLEQDVVALEEMYPQGEKAETAWALTVLGYLGKLILGILGLIAHIVIYLMIKPPVSPFLNWVFIKLDNVWGLLGTAAFAFFCFYLLVAVVAGATMLGLRLVFITIHPMKWGATLMNSFLFNVGLILLCSISVIQFCATAFAYYAQATAAEEIFGHTLQSLRGIKYLYKYNVFQIAFVALAGLTFVYYAAFGWRRPKPTGGFQLSS
ncbi:LIMR family protein-like protein [Drosera capensis]